MSPQIDSTTLRERWVALEHGEREPGVGIQTLSLGVSTPNGPIRIGLVEEGRPALLVPVDMRFRADDIPETRGLSLSTRRLTVSGAVVNFLGVECGEERLEQVFMNLCEEIVRRIREGAGVSASVARTLTEYRDLLGQLPTEHVSRQVAVGLFGELLTLEQLTLLSPASWTTWVGTSGARHDFRLGNTALEVKASVRSDSQIPRIKASALDQFVPPTPEGELFLSYWSLEEDPGGRSVADLAQHLSTRIVANGFTAKLKDAGYEVTSNHLWSAHRFGSETLRLFRVDERFPCLTPSHLNDRELPLGVSHLGYTIDLRQASECELAERERDEVLRRFIPDGVA